MGPHRIWIYLLDMPEIYAEATMKKEDFTTKQMLEFMDVQIKKEERETPFSNMPITAELRISRLKAIRKAIQYLHFLSILGALPEIDSIQYLKEEIATLEGIEKGNQE